VNTPSLNWPIRFVAPDDAVGEARRKQKQLYVKTVGQLQKEIASKSVKVTQDQAGHRRFPCLGLLFGVGNRGLRRQHRSGAQEDLLHFSAALRQYPHRGPYRQRADRAGKRAFTAVSHKLGIVSPAVVNVLKRWKN